MKLWTDKKKLQSALTPVLTEHEDSLQLLYANDEKAPAVLENKAELFCFRNINEANRFHTKLELAAPDAALLPSKMFSPLLRYALKNAVKAEVEVLVYPEKTITKEMLEKIGYKKESAALFDSQKQLKSSEKYWQDVKRTTAIIAVDEVNKHSGRVK